MNTGKNIKWAVSKVTPSVKEVDYWVDLSADPNGGVIKYHDGKNWVNLNQTISLVEVKKMISPAFDKLDMIKVNKVEGKQLSTNDFTNEDKAKLAELKNYDDSELRELIGSLVLRLNDLEQLVA